MCRILIWGTLSSDAPRNPSGEVALSHRPGAKGVLGSAEWSQLEMKVLEAVYIKMVLGVLIP